MVYRLASDWADRWIRKNPWEPPYPTSAWRIDAKVHVSLVGGLRKFLEGSRTEKSRRKEEIGNEQKGKTTKTPQKNKAPRHQKKNRQTKHCTCRQEPSAEQLHLAPFCHKMSPNPCTQQSEFSLNFQFDSSWISSLRSALLSWRDRRSQCLQSNKEHATGEEEWRARRREERRGKERERREGATT